IDPAATRASNTTRINLVARCARTRQRRSTQQVLPLCSEKPAPSSRAATTCLPCDVKGCICAKRPAGGHAGSVPESVVFSNLAEAPRFATRARTRRLAKGEFLVENQPV